MRLTPIREDKWSAYTPCNEEGQSELLAFANGLDKKYRASLKRLFAIVGTACENNSGPRLFDTDISHYVNQRDKIYEFIAGPLRLLWFYSTEKNKIIICSHAFLKKSRKTPKSDIEKAVKLKKEFMKAARNDNIEIVRK